MATATRSEAEVRDDSSDDAATREHPVSLAEVHSAIPQIDALSYRVETDEDESFPGFSAAALNDDDVPGVINAIIGLHLVAEPPIVGAADPVIAANLATGD